jgi:hypothetical protein
VQASAQRTSAINSKQPRSSSSRLACAERTGACTCRVVAMTSLFLDGITRSSAIATKGGSYRSVTVSIFDARSSLRVQLSRGALPSGVVHRACDAGNRWWSGVLSCSQGMFRSSASVSAVPVCSWTGWDACVNVLADRCGLLERVRADRVRVLLRTPALSL